MTQLKKFVQAGCLLATALLFNHPIHATPVLSAPTTSASSPQPLGTTVTFTASATDTDAGTISYRYQIGAAGGSTLHMVRDFSVTPTFVFTPTTAPGNYQIVVTARNNSTLNTGQGSENFRFTSLVVGGAAVVTPTANPLVALVSSPPCAAGGLNMRVSVLRTGGKPFATNYKPCKTGETLNFLIGGMRAATTYSLTLQTWNGSALSNGTVLDFTTGTPSSSLFGSISVVTPATTEDSLTERFLLMNATPNLMAVDITGNPVWYYVDPSGTQPTLTRPVEGGRILMIATGANSAGTSASSQQIVREIDLAGNIIRETNATRVSEQVSAMSGIASNCTLGGTDCLVGSFHHEATPLPNGHTLVLTDEEKIFTDGTQGSSPTNPVDIIGDIIVDLDTNWQVAWYWRAFDHLNANRAAILGETCAPPGGGGCPPVLLINSGAAQDWLHGNALYYTSADGSILFSMRHQDWVIKIDYGNGTGTSNILWTLGKGGDFAINSTDPYPWFSHQHDPGFLQNGTSTLALFRQWQYASIAATSRTGIG